MIFSAFRWCINLWRSRVTSEWCVVLCCAVLLWCVVLCCVVLCCDVMCCAVLCCVVLCCVVLCCVVMSCPVLCCVVLCCVVLCCAVLCCAVRCGVVMCCHVLPCVVMCCDVMWCVVLCCDVCPVLQRAVFQGLSQEALSACIQSLLKASDIIQKNKVSVYAPVYSTITQKSHMHSTTGNHPETLSLKKIIIFNVWILCIFLCPEKCIALLLITYLFICVLHNTHYFKVFHIASFT